MRTDLHDAWTGKDAAAAQSQLREVWSAAATVHQTANTFGVTIERHGSEHLAWYKYNKPPSKDLPEAQSWMTGANERVTQAWSSLPQDLSTSLPPGAGTLEHGPASNGPAHAGQGPAGGGSHSLGSKGSAYHSSATDAVDRGSSRDGGAGTELAGMSPSGLVGGGFGPVPPVGNYGGGSGFGGPGLPPPIAGPNMSAPGLITPGGILGAQAARPGVAGTGRGGKPSGMAGEAESAGAGAETRPGTAAPMTGAGSTEKRERTRQTWLTEDEEVWTGGIEAAPQLIENEQPAVEAPEPVDPPIEIDLSADGDALSAILADLDIESPHDDVPDVSARIGELQAQLADLERQRDAKSGLPRADEDVDAARDWLTGEDA
ncbi:hypothetical protein [Actinoallomurus bryophytorum]|nr:hypothetical protein [Actinoallomurus bryophytorum]